MKKNRPPSISVRNGLKKLGNDLKKARLRRRLKSELVAERAGISRATLSKIQNGDPNVSIGSYAMVIFALGFKTDWMNLASIENDGVGQMIDDDNIPKRVRKSFSS